MEMSMRKLNHSEFKTQIKSKGWLLIATGFLKKGTSQKDATDCIYNKLFTPHSDTVILH